MKNSSIIMIVLLVIGAVYMFANFSQHTNLGSNQQEYVTKDVYSHYGTPNAKIAVITGMHPREELAYQPGSSCSETLCITQ